MSGRTFAELAPGGGGGSALSVECPGPGTCFFPEEGRAAIKTEMSEEGRLLIAKVTRRGYLSEY